jgi:uncharacterized protein YndB with AHSA1/START domain
MIPKPTGRVSGNDLILTRTFAAPIADVWKSVTSSDSTARWIGPWRGEPGVGRTCQLQMLFEQGEPWCDFVIDACDAPNHLAVTTNDDYGQWRLELFFTQRGDTTELRFVHHLSDRKLAGDAGPGWEYYLDMLVASHTGAPRPQFTDYYPAQKDHYLAD